MLEDYLVQWGLSDRYSFLLGIFIKLIALGVLCFLVNYIAKKVILRVVKAFIKKTDNKWDDVFVEKKVFQNLSHLAPAFLIYFLAPQWFSASADMIHRLANTYMLLVGCLVVDAVLNASLTIYQRLEVSRKKPIKGYVQAVKILLFFLTGLFVISVLLNRSPWGFLSIFGGLTAVLMLIFKDMILGLVAGVQLSANNMISVGDWIEMPNYGADGDVIDVTLTTVMVQNWDKTITTIPTYALVTDSFKNWKGMSESGGRRIKRAIHIDMNSIKFLNQPLLAKLQTFNYLKEYLAQKQQEIKKHNEDLKIENGNFINGRHLTNVGTFREYLIRYLRAHPKIHKDMTFLVRQLKPTEHGLPIEIYVFSTDQNWVNYEAIQADIFDHILAILKEFDLKIFQAPTGRDFRGLGFKS